jgi:putative transposase
MPLPLSSRRTERWSMDFMIDTLADDRGFRTLDIVDDFTRDCVAIEVDRCWACATSVSSSVSQKRSGW